jgi:hypothetical protein
MVRRLVHNELGAIVGKLEMQSRTLAWKDRGGKKKATKNRSQDIRIGDLFAGGAFIMPNGYLCKNIPCHQINLWNMYSDC